MGMSKTKRLVILVIVCLGLFLVIDFITGVVAPDQWAFDAAQAKCREKGWQDHDLFIHQSKVSEFYWLGKTAEIELTTRGKNQPKIIHVTLRKPINLLAWQVIAYNEVPHQD